MANLFERIRNVFEDEMLTSKEASALAQESVSAARNNKHSLDATEKIATRGEIASEALAALKRGVPVEIVETFASGRVAQYNKTAPYGQKIDINDLTASVNSVHGRFLNDQSLAGQRKQINQSKGMSV